MSEPDLTDSEQARNARRDHDAGAAERSGMRSGLGKSFALRNEIDVRRGRGEKLGKKRRKKK